MLNTFPVSERATLAMVCDDALVGYSAVDPRKFVDVYIKRRKAELSGQPYHGPNESISPSKKEEDGGWTPVGNKPPPAAPMPVSAPVKAKSNATKGKKKSKK